MSQSLNLSVYVRAMRLPFIVASILPFITGSFIKGALFSPVRFLFGLLAVIATHIAANLLNDYADSRSGADWHDKKFYVFFGGSKLIQEGILPERFYRTTAVVFFLFGSFCISCLAFLLRDLAIIGYYLAIVCAGVCYSCGPLRFSYRRVGEIAIFLLFGPALVMGGEYIQTVRFPTLEGALISLPFGFFTAAILYSNELPDYETDTKARKYTWVSLIGPRRAFILYAALQILGYCSIIAGVALGFLHPIALVALVFAMHSLKAAVILKQYPTDKIRLMQSSQLTILVQALVGLVLIAGVLL
jgi:1,4-dihydroxy-2-naphthoate polyprenyltransferase